MKQIVLAISVLTIMSFAFQIDPWTVPETMNNKENPLKPSEKNIALGNKIYKKMCWSCHGENGKGNGPAGVSLDPMPADFSTDKFQNQTDGAIYWKLSTGRGAMAPYENNLSEDQRWSIVNYLRTLK